MRDSFEGVFNLVETAFGGEDGCLLSAKQQKELWSAWVSSLGVLYGGVGDELVNRSGGT